MASTSNTDAEVLGGSRALNESNYIEAAACYKRYRDNRVKEGCLARYRYGAALVFRAVIEDMEQEDKAETLQEAWNEFKVALCDMEEDSGEPFANVNILCCLGQAGIIRGESQPEEHFERALNILKGLDKENDKFIALLCFKICECLRRRGRGDPTKYCTEAIDICEALLSGSDAVFPVPRFNQESFDMPYVDPGFLPNEAKISSVSELYSHCKKTLEELKTFQERSPSKATQSPTSSENPNSTSNDYEASSAGSFAPRASSARAESSSIFTDAPTPSVKEGSTEGTASSPTKGNQSGDLKLETLNLQATPGAIADTPFDVAASSKRCPQTSDRSVQGGCEHGSTGTSGDAGRSGVKRQLSTDSSSEEGTPTKKHPKDPSK